MKYAYMLLFTSVAIGLALLTKEYGYRQGVYAGTMTILSSELSVSAYCLRNSQTDCQYTKCFHDVIMGMKDGDNTQ